MDDLISIRLEAYVDFLHGDWVGGFKTLPHPKPNDIDEKLFYSMCRLKDTADSLGKLTQNTTTRG